MPALAHFIWKIQRLSWGDRLLLVEAMFLLAVAAIAIAVLPFRLVMRIAERSVGRRTPTPQTRLLETRRARWAIAACARRVPWRAMCFQQGLAAQIMLRRRGIPTVLYYGAAPDEQGHLSAHVWVRDGEFDVVGGEVAINYAVLATFPSQSANKQGAGSPNANR